MSAKTREDESFRKKLIKEGIEPIVPGGEEEGKASQIIIKNNDSQDLAKLLEDTAKYIRASEGKAEAGHFENKETLFKRIDIGDFVMIAHRS